MTAGIKTSEFWVTLIASNIVLFSKQLGWELDPVTVMSVTTMVVGYIGARTWAKKD